MTPVYAKCPAKYLIELANALQAQTYKNFEWIVLIQGDVPPEIDRAAAQFENEPRFRFLRWPENRGIAPALRHCLEQAKNDYAVSIDADDLITPDALQILASTIEKHGSPAVVYSDEDHLFDGLPAAPYIRPDWDPILNAASSYIWHTIAFRRAEAIELGVFSDAKTGWCPDWEIIMQFAHSGAQPVHVPEALYHWRRHNESSTNRPDPESGSLASQKHILQRHIGRQAKPELYEVASFPIFRGSPEWAITRKQVSPIAMETMAPPRQGTVAFMQAALKACRTELVCFLDTTLTADPESIWETCKLFELQPDLALVSGKIVDSSGAILAGGELFSEGGVYSPLAGKPETDPGPFALALKPRSVSAVNPAFFIGRTRELAELVEAIPTNAPWVAVGAWLGAVARSKKLRVGYSPLIRAVQAGEVGRITPNADELHALRKKFANYFPETRWSSVFVPFENRSSRQRARCA